jgi:hypothetical protein
MILDEKFFGLSAQIKQPTEGGVVNDKFCYYDLNINRKREEKKVRDLFFAKNIIRNMHYHEPKYTSIHNLCKKLNRNYTVINRVTSSIFIKYNEGGEKKTLDIGLKLRNNNQKLHIPMDVVYSESIDPYKHEPTQFWGFSERASDVINDYLTTFPWISQYIEARAHFEGSSRVSRYKPNVNRMNTLEDAMPFIETEEERLTEVKRLTDWLSGCELANRSFVPAGFRFLSLEIRKNIEDELNELKAKENLEVPSELTRVDPRSMFSELFPFWSSPFIASVKDHRFGDRVANINTTKRKFIPFGSIGTVIGSTLDSVIVRFDEPNVALTDVHDTCPPYTGAVVGPESLINLTVQSEIKFQNRKIQNFRTVEDKEGYHHGYNKGYKQGYNKNYREGHTGGQKFHGGNKGKEKFFNQGKPHEEQKQGSVKQGYTKYGKIIYLILRWLQPKEGKEESGLPTMGLLSLHKLAFLLFDSILAAN